MFNETEQMFLQQVWKNKETTKLVISRKQVPEHYYNKGVSDRSNKNQKAWLDNNRLTNARERHLDKHYWSLWRFTKFKKIPHFYIIGVEE